ncbi:hypothetical protein U9M48_023130 [Paspalum notatum var. saurae]|uniref:Response regulatory domain-containing protein n=1 Tax=Paspalum notatum var. saurae TaxID=547442 RepID=A0AAQ3TL99_PASNO
MGAGAEGEPAAAAVRVLVVDDSPVDRKVVELLLRNHKGAAAPFHVTAVDSGKKAMERLTAELAAVDVVLTDYCMPEMTGYDLLKAIKALGSPNPIPVVVMSSENEPQRISRCLTAGAEDFILKPLRSKDVQRLRDCSGAGGRRRPTRDAAAGAAPPPCASSSSSTELSHYFQFQLLFKLVLLAYAVLCLGELLHRCSNGGSFLSLWSSA